MVFFCRYNVVLYCVLELGVVPWTQNYFDTAGRFILRPRTSHANLAQNYSWVPCRFCLRSVNRRSIMTQNLGSLPQPKCNVNVYYLSVLGPICLRLKTRRAIMDPKFGRLDTRQALCCNYYVAHVELSCVPQSDIVISTQIWTVRHSP